MTGVCGWWPGGAGYLSLDEYVCGIFAKSSRELSKYLCTVEDAVYSDGALIRDAVWLSYLRFAVSILMGFLSIIVFGVIGSLLRESYPWAAIFLSGIAFFLSVLRG